MDITQIYWGMPLPFYLISPRLIEGWYLGFVGLAVCAIFVVVCWRQIQNEPAD